MQCPSFQVKTEFCTEWWEIKRCEVLVVFFCEKAFKVDGGAAQKVDEPVEVIQSILPERKRNVDLLSTSVCYR